MEKIIYVKLLDEGVVCFRPVEAIELSGGKYKIIQGHTYVSNDEEWEFPVGAIVSVKEYQFSDNTIGLLAYDRV